MKGSELLSRAATVLQDDDHVRWPLPELVRWINDGLRAIVLAKPSASSESVAIALEEGTLQSLSDDSHLVLLRIPRNLKDAGPARIGGRAIRPTSREMLDASMPDWHDPVECPQRAQVRQYVFDEANPREFYVYPGNDGTGIVEAIVSVMPALVTASGDAAAIGSYAADLPLPEPYGIVLLDYVLYRAFSKDDTGADVSRARLHLQAFSAALGIKAEVEGTHSPNSRAGVAST